MRELQICLPETTAELLCKILLPLTWSKKKEAEMFFSTTLIDNICKNNQYQPYIFAHNLEGHKYWRIRIGKITLEYIVVSDTSDDNNAYVHQVFIDGQLVYRKSNEPKCRIYVHYKQNT